MNVIEMKREENLTIVKRKTAEELLHDDGPYTRLLSELVTTAKQKDASDIHIEPNDLGVALRLRINGNIFLYKQVGLQHRESLILEAKRVFGLAIGVSGRPQDGRASIPSLRLDLRVSLLPTHFGEKIVMRLLNLDATFELDELGFTDREQSTLQEAICLEDGVIVVSGPTGSGKTRTLYALLKAIGPEKFNIVTLEDPIEYRIEGLNQVQVSKKMTFADALRSVLRQDPDVILVGEVRDAETAKLCFQAAETGHLVLTTLHANGALEAVERLKGLGIDELTLKSSLRLSIAQRLEQRPCPYCSIKVSEGTVLANFREELTEYHRRGQIDVRKISPEHRFCDECVDGVSGRVPLLEWAKMTSDRVTNTKELALWQSLKEAKIIRTFRGEIPFEEVNFERDEE